MDTKDRNKRHYKKEILKKWFPRIGQINDKSLDEISDGLEIAPEDVCDENAILYKFTGKLYIWVDGPSMNSRKNPYMFVRLEENSYLGEDGDAEDVIITSRNKALREYQPALIAKKKKQEDATRLVSGDKNLSGLDVMGQEFPSGLDLSGVNLTRANLASVELKVADFTGANLTRASLARAVLTDSTFKGADLNGTFLSGSDLRGADLSGLTLIDTMLWKADLRGADLRGTDLSNARLIEVKLDGAKMEGAILGRKKAKIISRDNKVDLSKAILVDDI